MSADSAAAQPPPPTADADSPQPPKRDHAKAARKLFWMIVAAMPIGIAVGLAFPAEFDASGQIIEGRGGATELSIFGDLFLSLLFMIVVPLIMTSIITGVGSLGDIRKVGRLGWITVLFYLTTTVAAVLLGIVLVTIVQPGGGETITFLQSQRSDPVGLKLTANERAVMAVEVPAEADGAEIVITGLPDEARAKAGDGAEVAPTNGELRLRVEQAGRTPITIHNPGDATARGAIEVATLGVTAESEIVATLTGVRRELTIPPGEGARLRLQRPPPLDAR
jgi:hypothetical protein